VPGAGLGAAVLELAEWRLTGNYGWAVLAAAVLTAAEDSGAVALLLSAATDAAASAAAAAAEEGEHSHQTIVGDTCAHEVGRCRLTASNLR